MRGTKAFAQHARPALDFHLRPAVPSPSPEAEARASWSKSEELRALVQQVYAADYRVLYGGRRRSREHLA